MNCRKSFRSNASNNNNSNALHRIIYGHRNEMQVQFTFSMEVNLGGKREGEREERGERWTHRARLKLCHLLFHKCCIALYTLSLHLLDVDGDVTTVKVVASGGGVGGRAGGCDNRRFAMKWHLV